MKEGRTLSFYIEIIVMLVMSVLVISVVAGAFSKSESYSRSARHLSDAVTLAAQGAEVFLASKDRQQLFDTLNEKDNASMGEDIEAYYDDDLNPESNGKMKMVIDWDESEGFADALITVYYNNEKIYDLETGAVKGGGK